MWRGGQGVDWTTQLELVRERSHRASTQRVWRDTFLSVLWRFIGRILSRSLQATAIVAVALRVLLLAVLFSKIFPITDCASTAHRASYENTGVEDPLDYDIHVPLSAMPLGINVGPSLEILSFRKGDKTGELSWIARRGWLSVGDKLLALEGRDVSQARRFPRLPPPLSRRASAYCIHVATTKLVHCTGSHLGYTRYIVELNPYKQLFAVEV